MNWEIIANRTIEVMGTREICVSLMDSNGKDKGRHRFKPLELYKAEVIVERHKTSGIIITSYKVFNKEEDFVMLRANKFNEAFIAIGSWEE